MEVAGTILSPLVKSVYDNLAAPQLIGFARQQGVAYEIQKLKETLEVINEVLADAEDKQGFHTTVKEWLQELRDLAYDADDVVDDFVTEALRKKLIGDPEASTSKVRRLIPTCCTSFTPRAVALNWSVRSRIKDITNKLQEIAERRTELEEVLERGVGQSRQMPSDVWQGRTTTILMKEPSIYGRDDDKNQIVQLLLRDAPGKNKVDVIPIVGMGGSGKTTLAQWVYNDYRVGAHFHLKAWVCVSDQFDVRRLTKEIVESFNHEACNLGALNELQNKLRDTLKDKRFLLVLDDIWDHSYDAWISLRTPFGVGANGSKVIVTTRHSNIASRIGTVKQHDLQNLSDDDCWKIFAQHAFITSIENRNIGERDHEELRKMIVTKCKGLPLAARALGGLLRSKQNVSEWNAVLQSDVWSDEGNILPVLKLSYYHLPIPLKRCFGYCAIIPKDYEFEEEELVFLWMAQGLLQDNPRSRMRKEELGREYFQELVSRSLFQKSIGDSSKFIMNNLINDLAQAIAGDMCCRLENPTEGERQKKMFTKVRHSSYMASYCDGLKKFEVLKKATCLRTFVQFLPTSTGTCHPTGYLFRDLLPKLRCLRELRLQNSSIYEVSDSIGDLKHLRYINLSGTRIRRLPNSVVTLYNLEVLLLRFCRALEKLPRNMGSLVNLRHFDITGVDIPSRQKMPLHISKLENLQTLSHFMVGNGRGNKIGELKNLDIRGAISISRLENVADAQEAMEANLNSKHGLTELRLEWGISPSPENAEVDKDVLEMLKPGELLEKLTISGYRSTTFPNWVGVASFSQIVSMQLVNCQHCTFLPPLGQLPSLQDLYVEGMSGVKYVGDEFNGQGSAKPFPSLEKLTFIDMLEWNEWSIRIDNGDQPYNRLSKLTISNCPQLVVDVSGLVLPSLTTLSMNGVQLPGLPALLKMRNGPESGSLLTLEIRNVSVPDSLSLCDSSVADELQLGYRMSKHLHSITSLEIDNLEKLKFLPTWFTGGLMRLKVLRIRKGKELLTLWKDEVRLHKCLPSLLHLEISNCPKLICLLEEEEETSWACRECKQQQHKGLPWLMRLEEEEETSWICGQCKQQQHKGLHWLMRLERLEIDTCPLLKKLPQGLHTLKYLAELRINGCASLVSFPQTGLPSMLRKLDIKRCPALQSLPALTNLQELYISQCESLRHLSSRGGLPSTLKEIRVDTCVKLEAILGEEGKEINCPSLESFIISDCRNLGSLPGALDSNLRKLNRLVIVGCDNLKSLPKGWFDFHILKELSIRGCKKLRALPLVVDQFTSFESLRFVGCNARIVSCFLKEESTKFLTSLRTLVIGNMSGRDLPSPSEWCLHKLTSLQSLTLTGHSGMVSFPEDGMLLPTDSLKELEIIDMPDLKKLSSGFQNLTSLETLEIVRCPKLACFPKEGLPPKLLHLEVSNCPKLASSLKQGLPPSLLTLDIDECPKLKQQCKKGRGRYWDKIVNIPLVEIDWREEEV